MQPIKVQHSLLNADLFVSLFDIGQKYNNT